MARRKTAGLTLAEMVQPIRRLRDAAKVLFQVQEHVALSRYDEWPIAHGLALYWDELEVSVSSEDDDEQRVLSATKSLEFAVKDLVNKERQMQEVPHRGKIRAAVMLVEWALQKRNELVSNTSCYRLEMPEETQEPWVQCIRRAVGWLDFVEDMATLQAMPTWQREVLQIIEERGPSTQKELAKKMGKPALSSNQRGGLPQMVTAGLLNSGRGAESDGYSLTQLGLRMAQLSRQLRDF